MGGIASEWGHSANNAEALLPPNGSRTGRKQLEQEVGPISTAWLVAILRVMKRITWGRTRLRVQSQSSICLDKDVALPGSMHARDALRPQVQPVFRIAGRDSVKKLDTVLSLANSRRFCWIKNRRSSTFQNIPPCQAAFRRSRYIMNRIFLSRANLTVLFQLFVVSEPDDHTAGRRGTQRQNESQDRQAMNSGNQSNGCQKSDKTAITCAPATIRRNDRSLACLMSQFL